MLILAANSQTRLELGRKNTTEDWSATRINNYIRKKFPDVAQFSYLIWADTETDAVRINQGDEYVLTWNGVMLSGVDFTNLDNKRWVQYQIFSTRILADGIQTAQLMVTVFTAADKNIVDTGVNGMYDVPVTSPSRTCHFRLNFVNGVADYLFSTQEYGTWYFPFQMGKYVNGYRLKGNPDSIKALYPLLTEASG